MMQGDAGRGTVEPMSSELHVPLETRSTEAVIRRSHFIGKAQPLDSPAAVRELVQREREEHKGCTHVVHAFVTGEVNSQVHGSSDDGEPKGTAGRPVLEVLKGSGFTNILLTVVRYYGGTQLGTGGLVKAYSDSAREVLRDLPGKPLRRETPFRVEVPYPLYEKVKAFLAAHGGTVIDERFGTAVCLEGRVPAERHGELASFLADISAGRIRL